MQLVIEPGQFYRTRDGRKVMILEHIHGPGMNCWEGVIKQEGGNWVTRDWRKDGGYNRSPHLSGPCDLVGPWEEPKYDVRIETVSSLPPPSADEKIKGLSSWVDAISPSVYPYWDPETMSTYCGPITMEKIQAAFLKIKKESGMDRWFDAVNDSLIYGTGYADARWNEGRDDDPVHDDIDGEYEDDYQDSDAYMNKNSGKSGDVLVTGGVGKIEYIANPMVPENSYYFLPTSILAVKPTDTKFTAKTSGATKCECGATKCGHLKHSSWCPLHTED